MRRARVLVFYGWMSAAGMLVNAVACSDNVDRSSAADVGDAGSDADASVTADASSDVTLDTRTVDTSPEDSSDSSLPESADDGPDGVDGTTDSGRPSEAAPTDTGPDSPAGDSMPGDSTDEESTAPIPDAGDGGEADSPEESEAPCGDAAIGPTACAIQGISPGCLTCAVQMGCLDPLSQNMSCDQFIDAGGLNDCLATFLCAIANNCGVTVGDASCLCGSDDASACATGTEAPIGACASTYFAGFGTNDAQTILASYNDPTTPSGNGNLLVQCLQMLPCTACF